MGGWVGRTSGEFRLGGNIQMEKLREALGIWKGFLGLILGPKLNLIMMFMGVVVDDLVHECNCYGRTHREKWREIFRKREERKENKKGPTTV